MWLRGLESNCSMHMQAVCLHSHSLALPHWHPVAQVKRSSDSSDTKSAKFCSNNGVLGEEGWYVFDYCS